MTSTQIQYCLALTGIAANNIEKYTSLKGCLYFTTYYSESKFADRGYIYKFDFNNKWVKCYPAKKVAPDTTKPGHTYCTTIEGDTYLLLTDSSNNILYDIIIFDEIALFKF